MLKVARRRIAPTCSLGIKLWLLPLVAVLLAYMAWGQQAALKKPPKTRRDNVREVLHGVEMVDPYRWLEDQNSPETRAWIAAQNEYSRPTLRSLPGRQQHMQRLTELLKIDVFRTPRERNGRYFFSKRLADQELFVIYMRKGLNGEDQVLIDPHPMSPDRTTSVNLQAVSRDGSLLAYGVRQGGEDEIAVRLLDVETRKDLPDRLPKSRYFGVAMKPDNSGFYYSRFGAEGPRVYYHAMGEDPADDRVIFGKGYGPEKISFATLSEDGRHLLIHVVHGSSALRTEIYYQDLVQQGQDTAQQGPIVPVVNDIDAKFEGEVGGEQLFLHTNWKAPKGRILAVELENPARERWREIIPESDAVIEDVSLAGGNIFVNYLENVKSRVKVFEPDGEHTADIAFPAIGSVSEVGGRWESREAFFAFSSFHIPTTIYRYDVSKLRREVWARLEVPVESDKLELRQVWYQSKDKTWVPMFLLHAKGLKPDGSNPTLLTGYGGFNITRTPRFSASAVLWAENGGVYALPNLRGGGEFGEQWHKAGMLEKKQNVFDDFIAAAEWLIRNGYTRPSKLAIGGRSNGGLLVGAALTQRPELFQAVVCGYPLLDMVRYQNFLVARFWVSEYGSSNKSEQFKYLHAYSPYHRVQPGVKYPAVLFVTGDGDTRVDPLHARKMTALLQAATGSERPVLLRYETTAGHSGGRPVSKTIEDVADELGFLLWQLGPGRQTTVTTGKKGKGTN